MERELDVIGQDERAKGIPTLTRCGELGGMHVHAGKLPFPELERF